MKTLRRIIAVLLLAVSIFAVGYLCFTGSRLQEKQEETAWAEE